MTSAWGPGSLLPVEPIGIGTDRVEGLSGYLTRLAGAHVVPTRILIKRVFPEALGSLGYVRTQAASGRRGAWINGSGRWAREVSRVFSVLTRQPDLHRLTLLAYKRVLPGKSLLASVRRWCPECYREMESEGSERWDPLAWSVAVVLTCQRHDRILSERCSVCGSKQPWLSYDTPIGWCALCGADLAGAGRKNPKRPDPYDLWCAGETGTLVGTGSVLETPAEPGRLVQTLDGLIRELDQGSLPRFAGRIGVDENSVRRWRKRSTIPTDMLMLMCWSTGLRPVDCLVTGDLSEAIGDPNRDPSRPQGRRRRWIRRNPAELGRDFDRLVRTDPTLRIKEIAARLDVGPEWLRIHLGDRVQAQKQRRRTVRGRRAIPSRFQN